MQRFTISLDDDLAQRFDAWARQRNYANRSEAVRDLAREALERQVRQADAAHWYVASLSFVYDHHDQVVVARLLDAQHEHHDIVVSSLHTHLDHDHCLETVVLKGEAQAVRAFCDRVIGLRGVRHGQAHLIALEEGGRAHRHAARAGGHRHLTPGT